MLNKTRVCTVRNGGRTWGSLAATSRVVQGSDRCVKRPVRHAVGPQPGTVSMAMREMTLVVGMDVTFSVEYVFHVMTG